MQDLRTVALRQRVLRDVSAIDLTARLLGRAWAYALAGGGQRGVAHMLDLIAQEMRAAMALAGVTKIGDIDGSVIAHSCLAL